MEPAEFILKIIIIATLTFGILGMIVQSSQFEGIISVQDAERLSIDLAHAASSMSCLTEKVNGESRKGILLEKELDRYQGSKDACISLEARWSISVTDGSDTWFMGRAVSDQAPSKTLPITIKKSDGKTVPGTLTAKVEALR